MTKKSNFLAGNPRNRKNKSGIGVLDVILEGYFFIRRDGHQNADVYVSLGEFIQAKITPQKGMRLQFDYFENAQNKLRATDLRELKVDSNGTATVTHISDAPTIRGNKPKPSSGNSELPEYNGTVKYINWEKGYGFISRREFGEDDIFVFHTVLKKAGVTSGQDVNGRKVLIVKIGPGHKGHKEQVDEFTFV